MKKLFTCFAVLMPLALCGCSDAVEETAIGPDDKGKGKLESLTVNYVIQGIGLSTNTRAQVPAEEGEMEVHSLYFLFFEHTTGKTGRFLTYIDAGVDTNNPLVSSQTVKIDFPSGSGLSNSEAYNILAVANLHEYLSDGDVPRWLNSLTGKTEEYVINKTMVSSRDALNASGDRIESDKLLMSARAVKESRIENVDIVLIRALARFDVTNYMDGYTLTRVEIWNAFQSSTIWESSFNDYSLERTRFYYGVGSGDGKTVKGKLYAFENLSPEPEVNDNKTTCLIIGLKNNNTNALKYYRVNVHPSGQAQSLMRNKAYHVSIRGVNEDGGTNHPKDAYTGQKLYLNVDINQWDVAEDGTLLMDSENVLALPTTKITFSEKGGEYLFNVFTSGPGTLEIGKNSLPDNDKTTMHAELTGDGKTLKVTCTPSSNTSQSAFELKIGALKGTITVEQTGMADKFLRLSVDEIPPFASTNFSLMEGGVKVTSSGPWTARIYNGRFDGLDVFSFNRGANTHEVHIQITGNSADEFSIYTREPNPSEDPRYAFVMVSLDEDPNIKSILLLKQVGATSFALTPTIQDLTFSSVGDVTTGVNEFGVRPGGGEQWRVELVPYDAAANEHFKITYYDAGGRESGSMVSGDGSFKIQAPINFDRDYDLKVRVYYTGNTSVQQFINLKQGKVKWNKPTVQDLPARNGDNQKIPVITGAMDITSEELENLGYRYRLTISGVEVEQPYLGVNGSLIGNPIAIYGYDIQKHVNGTVFDNGDKTITLPVSGGATFRIQMPYIPFALMTAKAIVDIEIISPENRVVIRDSFVQYQSEMILKDITATAARNYYGSIYSITTDYYSRFRTFAEHLKDNSLFGPSHDLNTVVYSNGVTIRQSYLTSPNVAEDFIYQVLYTGGNTADVVSWHGTDDRRIIICIAHNVAEARNALERTGMDTKGYGAFSIAGDGTVAPKAVNNNTNVQATKLWQYLMKDGPATKGVPVTPNLKPVSDGTYCEMTSWPDTFIPILFNTGGSAVIDKSRFCAFGIDPTLRFIWIGDTEIFSAYHYSQGLKTGADGNYYDDPASANSKFMNNIIAWIVNTAQYGDDFNGQFQESVSNSWMTSN